METGVTLLLQDKFQRGKRIRGEIGTRRGDVCARRGNISARRGNISARSEFPVISAQSFWQYQRLRCWYNSADV